MKKGQVHIIDTSIIEKLENKPTRWIVVVSSDENFAIIAKMYSKRSNHAKAKRGVKNIFFLRKYNYSFLTRDSYIVLDSELIETNIMIIDDSEIPKVNIEGLIEAQDMEKIISSMPNKTKRKLNKIMENKGMKNKIT